MKYILALFLLTTTSQLSFSQTTVKELDRIINKQEKKKLSKIKLGKGFNQTVIFYWKSDRKLYSIVKVEKADNNAEAREMLQFAYINDTLLRVYYFTRDPPSKKHILAIFYLAGDSVIASELKGNLPVPDINILKQKSDLFRTQGQEIIDSRNG